MLSGIILAAGNSSRMGRPKALLEYGGLYFIEIVCRNLRSLGLRKITVALGKDSQAILEKWRPQGEEVIFNDRPELGQIHSLRLALERTEKDSSFMVCLVDQPLIKQETYLAIKDFWLANPGHIIIPRCRRDAGRSQVSGSGFQVTNPNSDNSPLSPILSPLFLKRGHPIIIPAVYRDLCFRGPVEKGLHWVTHHESVKVLDLTVEDEGILRDFDTPEDYGNLSGTPWWKKSTPKLKPGS